MLRFHRDVVLILATVACSSANPARVQDQAEAAVDTTYIPTDLSDALAHLEKLLSPEMLTWVRDSAKTEGDMVRLHFGLGMWLRNNWGLWGGSRLAEYFNEIGIFHPDDMSGIILDSFWRQLHNRPIDLLAQAHFYQRYWRIHTPPDSLAFPECPAGVELKGGVTVPPDTFPGFVHLGMCSCDGTWWAFEKDRGWYRPDATLVTHFLRNTGR